jgi:hypothetical protein
MNQAAANDEDFRRQRRRVPEPKATSATAATTAKSNGVT